MSDLQKIVEAEATLSVGKLSADGTVSNKELNVDATPHVGYSMYVPSILGHEGEFLSVQGEQLAWFDIASSIEELKAALNEAVESGNQHTHTLDVTSDGLIYLVNDQGERYAGPFGPFAGNGSGGGGGGGTTTMSIKNTTGWLSKTYATGSTIKVSLNWSSLLDGEETGQGVATITVNSSIRATYDVEQGDVTIDLTDYLAAGSNRTVITIMDGYGNTRMLAFSISLVELSITSTFDQSTIYNDVITFTYIPVGSVLKTVHIIVDDAEIATTKVSASGRQQTYVIPAQSHGAHTLRCYFDAEVNNETVSSNELFYEFISVEADNLTPVIASSFRTTTAEQYRSIPFTFLVYDPSSLSTSITINIDGTDVSKQTVDRTIQTYTFKSTTVETLTLKISVDNSTVSRSFEIEITETTIKVSAETDSLVLYLTASGRSNNETSGLSVWQDEENGVHSKLTNFNFESDGWVLDSDSNTVLRVSGDARVDIPYKPFATDWRTTGKTIELEFATSSVRNYDAEIISCMSGNRGFVITPQKVTLKTEQSEISTQFKEDEHVRISFVAEKRAENRLLYCYINGIDSGCVQYPTDDDFAQATPVDITIGSNDCTTDIYCIRVYDNDLNPQQVLTNWIADTQDYTTLVDRYTRNDVFDEYGEISIGKLPKDLPYMIITCEELPQYKGDKKTVSITYVDPVNPSKSFTASGVELNVQGTSSQYYARKNYKASFKKGLTLNDGSTASKYSLHDGMIPEKTFCFKADVASSEGANNVELVRLYNDACPYKTPAQQGNSYCRQGIDGFPMVIFWNDGSTTTFLGKYNFNLDKSDETTFGFQDDDESWEILNNTSNRVLWKSADYSTDDWLKDFEARFPDLDTPYQDYTQLKAFADFVSSTDTTVSGLTDDEKAERLTTFKEHIGEYTEIQDAIFYYLFTELFLMVDSRAKNAFPSFMGSSMTEATT